MKELSLISIGFLVVLVGFILIIIGFFLVSGKGASESNAKFSFFGLIGPFPIGFGNDRALFIAGMIFTIIILIIFFLMPQKP